MCPPEFYAVDYAINPWMDTSTPVDTELALKQWERLRETLTGLGHTVHVLPAEPGLPDMVYAANGATVVDGTVLGARFRHPERQGEAAAYRAWFAAAGYPVVEPEFVNEGEGDLLVAGEVVLAGHGFRTDSRAHAEAAAHRAYLAGRGWSCVQAVETNEGEGDFAYLPDAYGGLILAGYGFRTEPAAHVEAQDVLGRPVVSLHLVDPRFYHLDTALAALDDRTVAYYPAAFSESSQRVLRQLFPDAVRAADADAYAFGLNLVSDGRHVVLNSEATGMARKVEAAGFTPVLVELSELKKGGGSVKCCVAELR
jgi:N-dimethylarginine dimethylaminohydrolase